MRSKLRRSATAILCLALVSCASLDNPYRPSFVEMARQASAETSETQVDDKSRISNKDDLRTSSSSTTTTVNPETNKYAKLRFSDQLALNYANEMVNILRPRFNRSRRVREASATAQVAMAGVAGAAGPFHLTDTTLAILGIGGAGIPELQRIFNAKGRAENYQVAVNMIEDAVVEYLSYNQQPSPDILTQNGVSVVHRTDAAIHIVEQSLAGVLPTVQQMQQATERMSATGAVKTPATAKDKLGINNVPANARVEAAVEHFDRPPEFLDPNDFAAAIAKVMPRPPPPPKDLPSVKQFRTDLIALDKSIPEASKAKIYHDIFEEVPIDIRAKEFEGLSMQENAVGLNEAYRVLGDKRRRILDLVAKLKTDPTKSPVP